MNKKAYSFFEEFLSTLPSAQRRIMASKPLTIDYFCNDEKNANFCAHLVVGGQKTATSSLKIAYEKEGESLPQKGDLQIVTDWDENPICLIEIIDVKELPFSAIAADFAKAEGEGDLSLAWWQKTHRNFFTEECHIYGLSFHENIIVICERFKKIYPL